MLYRFGQLLLETFLLILQEADPLRRYGRISFCNFHRVTIFLTGRLDGSHSLTSQVEGIQLPTADIIH